MCSPMSCAVPRAGSTPCAAEGQTGSIPSLTRGSRNACSLLCKIQSCFCPNFGTNTIAHGNCLKKYKIPEHSMYQPYLNQVTFLILWAAVCRHYMMQTVIRQYLMLLLNIKSGNISAARKMSIS